MIYEYNEEDRTIKIDNKMVYLEPKENEIFKLLYNNRNKIVTYEEIIEKLSYGYLWNLQYKAVIIHRLRKKFGDSLEIRTICKKGYKLVYYYE